MIDLRPNTRCYPPSSPPDQFVQQFFAHSYSDTPSLERLKRRFLSLPRGDRERCCELLHHHFWKIHGIDSMGKRWDRGLEQLRQLIKRPCPSQSRVPFKEKTVAPQPIPFTPF